MRCGDIGYFFVEIVCPGCKYALGELARKRKDDGNVMGGKGPSVSFHAPLKDLFVKPTGLSLDIALKNFAMHVTTFCCISFVNSG